MTESSYESKGYESKKVVSEVISKNTVRRSWWRFFRREKPESSENVKFCGNPVETKFLHPDATT